MIELSKVKDYTSKDGGVFRVVDDKGYNQVLITFESGYSMVTRRAHVISGEVKDRLKKNIYGIGFIGGTEFKSTGKGAAAYKRWSGMFLRCYDTRFHKKRPTYIGCSVCDDWHDFQVYAAWHMKNFIAGFDLDKDILVDGNKIYSPETCIFASPLDNSVKAKARSYSLTSPDGVVTPIYNMSKFCRENNLSRRHIHSVITGSRKRHKGWSK